MKKHWQDYKQQTLLIVTTSLLLLDTIFVKLGYDFAVKIIPILMAIIASICLIYWQTKVNKKAVGFLVFLLAWFLTEVLLTKVVLNNSEFSYGILFGFKLLGIPIVIGLMWFSAFLSSITIVSYGDINNIKKYTLAVFLMLMFTMTFNQFASVFNILQWANGRVSFIYYLIWILFSLTVIFIIDKHVKINKPSIYIASILPVMSIYFWLLALIS